jgi:hypothetical protein
MAFAISVQREGGLLIADAEKRSPNRLLDLPRRAATRMRAPVHVKENNSSLESGSRGPAYVRLWLSPSRPDGPAPGSLVDRRGPVVFAFAQASKSASPVKGLATKTLERRSAPDTGELSQRRGRGAIAAGGQEGSRLPAVEPTLKFHTHI